MQKHQNKIKVITKNNDEAILKTSTEIEALNNIKIDAINEFYEDFVEGFDEIGPQNVHWLKSCINDFMQKTIKSDNHIMYDMHTSATLIHKLAVFINKNSKDINEELINQFKTIVYDILFPLDEIRSKYCFVNIDNESIDYLFNAYDYLKQFKKNSDEDSLSKIPSTRPEAISDFAEHILCSLEGLKALYNFVKNNELTLIKSLSASNTKEESMSNIGSDCIHKLYEHLHKVTQEPFIKTKIFVEKLTQALNKTPALTKPIIVQVLDIPYDKLSFQSLIKDLNKNKYEPKPKDKIFNEHKIFEYCKDKQFIAIKEFCLKGTSNIQNKMSFLTASDMTYYELQICENKSNNKVFSLIINQSYLNTKSFDIMHNINTISFRKEFFGLKYPSDSETAKNYYFESSVCLFTNVNKNQLLFVVLKFYDAVMQLIVTEDGQIFDNYGHDIIQRTGFITFDNTKKLPLLGTDKFLFDINTKKGFINICTYKMQLNIKFEIFHSFAELQSTKCIVEFDSKSKFTKSENNEIRNKFYKNDYLDSLMYYIDIGFKKKSPQEKEQVLTNHYKYSNRKAEASIFEEIKEFKVGNSKYLNKQIEDLICEFIDVSRRDLNKYSENRKLNSKAKELLEDLLEIDATNKDLANKAPMYIIKFVIETMLNNEYLVNLNSDDLNNTLIFSKKVKDLIQNNAYIKFLNYGADVLDSLISSIDDTADLNAADSIYNEVANYVYDAKNKNYENINMEHYRTQTSEQEIRLMEGEYNMHLAARQYNIDLLAGENDMNLIDVEDDMNLIGQERYMSEDSE